MGIPFDNPAFVARWRAFVDPATSLWTDRHDKDGYGIFTWTGPAGERLKFRAHRVAWAIANQRQPAGVIRHAIACSTPACCNPDCLSDGKSPKTWRTATTRYVARPAENRPRSRTANIVFPVSPARTVRAVTKRSLLDS